MGWGSGEGRCASGAQEGRAGMFKAQHCKGVLFFFEMYRIFSRVWSDHAEQEQAG